MWKNKTPKPECHPDDFFHPSDINCFYGAKTEKSNGQITQTVHQHSLAVFVAMTMLRDRMPPELCAIIPEGYVPHASFLHDLGKISPGFQIKLPTVKNIFSEKNSKYEKNHALISGLALKEYFKSKKINNGISIFADILSIHHGRIQASTYKFDEWQLGDINWIKERQKYINGIFGKYGEFNPDLYRNLTRAQKCFLAGLLVHADWLASSCSEYFLDKSDDEITKIVQRHVVTVLGTPKEFPPDLSFGELFSDGNTPYKINNLQKIVNKINGNWNRMLVESGTGTGKTEFGEYLYYRERIKNPLLGWFFGLPTTLTSNECFKRVNQFLSKAFESDGGHLIHSKAKYFASDFENNTDAFKWYSSNNKTKMLDEYGIGTVDQALSSVVHTSHFCLRLYSLANKMVILDEIHSYDHYMIYLIKAMIDDLIELNSKVVLLSATLSKEHKKFLMGDFDFSDHYPLVTVKTGGKIEEHKVSNVEKIKRHKILIKKIYGDEITDRVDYILKNRSNKKTLVVVNKVKHAQQLYKQIKARVGEEVEVGLIHSDTTEELRKKIEGGWVQKFGKNSEDGNFILIGTQILEQSLDIDADDLFVNLAPMDSIAQRMGRQWRHIKIYRDGKIPTTHILLDNLSYDIPRLIEKMNGSALEKELDKMFFLKKIPHKIYDPYIYLMTYFVLSHHGEEVEFPRDTRRLIDSVYNIVDASEMEFIPARWKDTINYLQRKYLEDKKRLESNSKRSHSTGLHAPHCSNKIGATRWIEQENNLLLICKTYDESRTSIKVVTLNDNIIILDKKRPNSKDLLALNVQTFNSWLPNDFKLELAKDAKQGIWKFMNNEKMYVFEVDREGYVHVNNNCSSLMFTEEMGLVK